MLHITLTADDRTALEHRRRGAQTPSQVRARCQMLLLSAEGWSPPRIATHLAYHPHSVRAVLRRFEAQGIAGLTPDRPGPPPDTVRREQVRLALDRLLGQERTWTAAQLAAALGEQGIALSRRQTRKYLGRMQAGWRRTVRTLHHKQDPLKVARATQTLTALKGGPRRTASRSPSSTNAASPPANP
jgi:putative transposase